MTRKVTTVVMVGRLREELDRLFQEALALGEAAPAPDSWTPAVDILETPDALRVLLELPGVAATALEVVVAADLLTVRGTKSDGSPPPGGAHFHRLERSGGRFVRQVRLPRPVHTARGRAWLEAGVLTVEFPKIEEQRRRPQRLAVEERGESADE